MKIPFGFKELIFTENSADAEKISALLNKAEVGYQTKKIDTAYYFYVLKNDYQRALLRICE